MPTIITYNVNGIRAAIKKDLSHWLSASNADVLCLQEIKANPEQFDEAVFYELGYTCFISNTIFSQKKWTLEKCIDHAKEHNLDVVKQKIRAKIRRAAGLTTAYTRQSSLGQPRWRFITVVVPEFLLSNLM